MEMEILLPEEVPVMTLPNTAFFPQALMPLHIFEPRYREMLRDVLAADRLFAVAGLDPAHMSDSFEPPHRVGTVGIIRACQKNDNGTSNLLLQGLCRVEVLSILRDEPYRKVRVRALTSRAGATADENQNLRRELARLLSLKTKLSMAEPGPRELASFLKTVDDPEAFVDIAAFSMCEDVSLKQRLLETLNVHRRLELFGAQLRRDIEDLKLRRKLQGHLPDDHICDN